MPLDWLKYWDLDNLLLEGGMCYNSIDTLPTNVILF